MDTSGWNMYVFRDGRRFLRGCDLVRSLRDAIEAAESVPSKENTIAALVIAGELSCALADAESRDTSATEEITNAIAETLLRVSKGDATQAGVRGLTAKLDGIVAPARVRLSVQ